MAEVREPAGSDGWILTASGLKCAATSSSLVTKNEPTPIQKLQCHLDHIQDSVNKMSGAHAGANAGGAGAGANAGGAASPGAGNGAASPGAGNGAASPGAGNGAGGNGAGEGDTITKETRNSGGRRRNRKRKTSKRRRSNKKAKTSKRR
jgi:hypothetical protein